MKLTLPFDSSTPQRTSAERADLLKARLGQQLVDGHPFLPEVRVDDIAVLHDDQRLRIEEGL